MINICICDDDAIFLKNMHDSINSYIVSNNLAMTVACVTTSPYDVINYLNNNPDGDTGLYFIDLDLKHAEIDGFGLAEQIRKRDPRGFIVIVTADADKKLMTFEYKLEVMDYIVKDSECPNKRIHECIDKTMEIFTTRATANHDYFVFKTSGDVEKYKGSHTLEKGSPISVKTDNVLYFETTSELKHTVLAYTDDGQVQLRSRLKAIEAVMDNNKYFKIRRDLIVNLSKIDAIDRDQGLLIFDNGSTVDVVKRMLKEIELRWKVCKKG